MIQLGGRKNKANSPAFGRKSEALNPKHVLSNVEWILNKDALARMIMQNKPNFKYNEDRSLMMQEIATALRAS